MDDAGSSGGLRTLLAIAWRDVVHERLMSVCLIVALAGLVAPLLVLFGLKSGVMESLRQRLVEDPVFRELRPAETRNYTERFFDEVRARPETEFIVESVLKGASVIRVEGVGGDGTFVDMLPSGDGDPLLLGNGATPPMPGTVVLSEPAARGIDADPGGDITLSTSRNDADGRREASAIMRVSGVLPLRADAVARVYVPRDFALDVESFREGFAVSARGWEGSLRTVEPFYHGVVVAVRRELGSVDRMRAIANTGFFVVEPLEPSAFVARFGIAPPEAGQLLDIRVIDSPVAADAVVRVRRALAADLVDVWPYTEGVTVAAALPDGSRRQLRLTGAVLPELAAGEVSLPRALDARLAPGEPVSLDLVGAVSPLTFDAPRAAPHDGEDVRMSPESVGILQRGLERALGLDEDGSGFVLEPLGYRGFRLFASSLDGVASLGDFLRSQGVETRSAVQEILRLKALDRGLGSLFAIIALAVVVTGMIVLLASQYGAVERKRVALAHLRLMGLSRREVALVPLVQGVGLALCGGVLGALVTLALCTLANTALAAPLGFEGELCVVTPRVTLVALVLAAVLSLLASSGAAVSVTRIDPAEGMRDE